ncbi:HNH endonuclease [Methylobacterium sp. 37f]|uniref:HNH endonuclease n=1 Tax=Methylobacterium sp. 37f TaxID=2817058 RepID=UPI001FFDC840|nr:HNH endonuclease [Methylobacterium sp. 37f]MCK2053802.1 HNH endonuclease [Methylobacterium sp. 37f]
MPKCIFCDTTLDRSTKPEHVLLNALGGRKTTTQVICSECNNQFGNGIDKALSAQVEVIRNMLQMKSGTGKAAPMLRKVQAGSEIVNMYGDGMIEPVVKPFSFEKSPDGSFNVEINVSSLEEVDRLIPNIAASLGMPEAEIRSQLLNAKGRAIERRPDTVHFPLSFGGHDAIRSATKACLVLWALKAGNDELRGQIYDATRTFVTVGSDDFLKARTSLDDRLLSDVDQVKEAYGPLFNLIYVRSNEVGRVVGHFTFYNVLGFQIVLAESGGLPNEKIGLASNPLSPSEWSDEAAALFDVSFDWLDCPERDETFKAQRERVSEVMRTYVDRSQPKEIHRIVDAVFEKHGVGQDDPIPEELRSRIFSEISARVAAHALSLPFEEAITQEQLQSVLGNRLPKPE